MAKLSSAPAKGDKVEPLPKQTAEPRARARDFRRRTHAVGPRPWGKTEEAARGVPWWAVRRMGPEGSAKHGPMFRHATRESALREATFLAEQLPGAVFVVLEAVDLVVVGEPEVKVRAGVPAPIARVIQPADEVAF